MDKTTAAILVDYEYYVSSLEVQKFVKAKSHYASMVALVTDPNHAHPDTDPNEFEWNVVISNVKHHDKSVFKISALEALKYHSNLYPALAVDLFDEDIYLDAGTLHVLNGDDFL